MIVNWRSAREFLSSAGRKHGGAARGASGYALIIVLWTLVLIAFVIAHLSAMGRGEIRISGNLLANAAARAAADGAINEAIFNLSNPQQDQRWPIDGNPHLVTIGNSRVTIRLQDEAWWINPNSASPALFAALLHVTGVAPQAARSLAAAVAEWVGSAGATRPQNAILADYQAAGLDYGPPGEPLETLNELGRVVGMTPAILAAIRPHLTLFGPPQPSPATLDPVVAAALAEVAAGQPVPVANQQPQDVLTTRITAVALGPGNASVTRNAIVRFGASLPHGYGVLAWRDTL